MSMDWGRGGSLATLLHVVAFHPGVYALPECLHPPGESTQGVIRSEVRLQIATYPQSPISGPIWGSDVVDPCRAFSPQSEPGDYG